MMTPVDRLTTAEKGVDLTEADQVIQDSMALIAQRDLKKQASFPNACRDAQGRLVVAAAAGTGWLDRDRVRALVEAGADAVVIDGSQGDSSFQHETVRWIEEEFPELKVIGGGTE